MRPATANAMTGYGAATYVRFLAKDRSIADVGQNSKQTTGI